MSRPDSAEHELGAGGIQGGTARSSTEQPPSEERGEPLRPVEEAEEEREVLLGYYPNLNSTYEPRDWDEPPWGHKETGDGQ